MNSEETPLNPVGSKEKLLVGTLVLSFITVISFAFIFEVYGFYFIVVVFVGLFSVFRITIGDISRGQVGVATFFVPLAFPFLAFFMAAYESAIWEHQRGSPWLELSMQQRQIVKALHRYHDQHGRLPPAVVYGPEGEPLHSWRVLVLPYLGEEELYKKFRLNEPWDSPENSKLLREIPKVFQPDRLDMTDSPFSTFHQVFVGPGAAFEGKRGLNLERDFPDGTEQTIILVEAFEPVPWTSPRDLPFHPDGELPQVGRPRKTRLGRIAWDGVRSPPQYFAAAMANGAVLALENSPDRSYLRAWITRNGGDKAED